MSLTLSNFVLAAGSRYLTPPECVCVGVERAQLYTPFIAHRPPAGGNISPSLQYIAISSSQ